MQPEDTCVLDGCGMLSVQKRVTAVSTEFIDGVKSYVPPPLQKDLTSSFKTSDNLLEQNPKFIDEPLSM